MYRSSVPYAELECFKRTSESRSLNRLTLLPRPSTLIQAPDLNSRPDSLDLMRFCSISSVCRLVLMARPQPVDSPSRVVIHHPPPLTEPLLNPPPRSPTRS